MTSRWRLVVPAWVRGVPADLAAVVVAVFATVGAVFLPVVSETPLRVVFGLPFVLFVPGYAFVAALFPEAGASEGATPDEASDAEGSFREGGIDGIERVALSFGVSIAVVPLLGLVVNFTPWGIRLVPIMISVGGFTLVATGVAVRRRQVLPPDERFRVPYRSWLASARSALFEPASRVDGALNVLLAVSVVLAVASVGYAVAVPKPGESFSELYLLTEDETGELVASDYPTEFRRGEGRSLVVGGGNHEHRELEYTVVAELQRVRTADNTTTVLEEREVQRFTPTLADNETWQQSHTVQPPLTGERLRLVYLLYRGDAPAEPTVENAYREVHLWVNVSATDG